MSEVPHDPYLRKAYFLQKLIVASEKIRDHLSVGELGQAETVVDDEIAPMAKLWFETLSIAVNGAGVTAGDFLGGDIHLNVERAGLVWSSPGGAYWPTPTGTFVYNRLNAMKTDLSHPAFK